MDTRRLLAGLAVATLAAPVLADDFVETFNGASNTAGWTYGPPPSMVLSGGNPGPHITSFVDTFAPRVRTTTPGNAFVGDWRSKNVTSFGVDLCTISTQFPALRECTLVLSSGSCEIYFLGTEDIPAMGAGWESRDFVIDPHSPIMPAGWAVFPGSSCSDPDTAWNTVMDAVTEVSIFYGDPTFFYIFDPWFVGFDNGRIVCADPWTDLGGGTAGVNGTPSLAGIGSLEPNTVFGIELSDGPPSEFILLWISLSSTPLNILGGTIHALPFTDQYLLGTNVSGEFSALGLWPPGVPPGTDVWFQFLCQDLTTFFTITMSNGLRGTTP